MPKKQSTAGRRARLAARGGEKYTSALRLLASTPRTPTGDSHDDRQLEFSGEIWQWRGPAPYYFVTVPEKQSLLLRAVSSGISYARGRIRVRAQVGDTERMTSVWPKDGGYVVPLKDAVRNAERLNEGDNLTLRLTLDRPPGEGNEFQPTTRSEQHDQAERPARRPDKPSARSGRSPGSNGSAAVGSRVRQQVTDDQLRIVPANEATWEDLQAVFGTRADSSRCCCQRYKMVRKESWTSVGADELAFRLRQQTACGQPDSTTTSGLVAYLDGEPVGWCAVDPRPDNPRLLSHCPVPWVGRTEDRADDSVWAVTCFVTRTGFRRRGISRALCPRHCQPRPTMWCPCTRGLPGPHRARARRYSQHFRRCRLRRGEQADQEARAHANRLPGLGGEAPSQLFLRT
ncbi:DUF1905 domain-containing protein [Actinopolymorpha pittospori]